MCPSSGNDNVIWFGGVKGAQANANVKRGVYKATAKRRNYMRDYMRKRREAAKGVAPSDGLEPPFAGPKPDVLPLDDEGSCAGASVIPIAGPLPPISISDDDTA